VRRIVALLACALVIASCTSEPTGGADSDGLATVGDGWRVTYASYFGGTGAEGGVVAAGADGTVYLGGSTDSSDLRSTPGAAIGVAPGGGDAFVARLDATGATTWLTYLGGSGSDELWGLAVAEDGSVYAYGTTASEDFPATPGAIDKTLDGPSDVFVAHLSDDGSAILDATYLGGSGLDQSTGTVALAEDGTIVVSGVTASADFPTTRGAMQERFGGGDATLVWEEPVDAFVAGLDLEAGEVRFATYAGGSGDDGAAGGAAIAPDGTIYLAGATTSDDLPTSADAAQRQLVGGDPIPSDGYVMALAPDGSRALWATYLGGDGFETFHGLDAADDGGVFVVGGGCGSFPATPGAVQTEVNGDCDKIVARFGPDGVLVYATPLGGSDVDWEWEGIVGDPDGRAFVVGQTESADFPVTEDAFQPTFDGVTDSFVAVISADGSTLEYGSYLGGSLADAVEDPVLTPAGAMLAAGFTQSNDVPVTDDAAQPTTGGKDDLVWFTLTPGAGG
jgi:hypothetical protein